MTLVPHASPDPQELLAQLEAASYGEIPFSDEPETVETWRGFTFTVGDLQLVVPFSSGYEIVPGATIQPLPMSRDWVRGMANIRGEIYTVVDLARFLGRAPAPTSRSANLFLLPDRKLKSALLLESRIGLKTFDQDLPVVADAPQDDALAPYLSAVIVDGDVRWSVIDIQRLRSADAFINISE